ncbi:MAG: [protein-PII] uridylyltransferase [Burkholderiaceae bacterium]
MSARPDEPASATAAPVATLRARVRDGKAALIDHFMRSRPTAPAAGRLLRALTRHAGHTLGELWTRCAMPPGAALVAVGGFGRGELFPYSDIDVLVLLPGDEGGAMHEALKAGVAGFLTACWDIGLEIGSSVRTVDECVAEARADVTVQTAMLESRLLCGQRRLYKQFQEATAAAMDARAFLRAKQLEMQQRHVKFQDTPYALEPNCKESPGGLRDLQMVIWVARAAGLGRTWSELAAKGLVTPYEVRRLVRHEGTLKLIRARLHALAQRREDRLIFDLQTAVAESFGLENSRAQRCSEVLMHRYYWAAKAVTQLNQILMLNIEERLTGSEDQPMRPINPRFFDRGGLLEVASDELYQRERGAILETFIVFQQEASVQALSARTLRALYHARDLMDAAYRRDARTREQFMQIIRQPSGQTHAFRLMNQTSVLGRTLWPFRRIVGRMQHDLFHVYTVDQHILMVLRNVRRFFIPEHAHEYPFCSQLAAQMEKPWLLYVAALFHDLAKGRGGDHSVLGAQEVRRFCRDHRIERDDAQTIEFLVRHHLTMSHIAQKEDLADPEVIERFVQQVRTPERLAMLYLLTVADIRGTGPKVWNAWKGKLLEDLYRLGLRALGSLPMSQENEIETRKHEAQQLLALRSALPGTEKPLWETLDVGYFARHDPAEIAWHARELWRHVKTAQPVVRARPSPVGEGLQVFVYSPDRTDLFARICGYFDGQGLSIQDAKIHTSRAHYALDTFQVVHPGYAHDDAAGHRDLISLIETGLARTLADEGPLPEPRQGRMSRRVRSFPVTPRVSMRPDERAQRWILEVSASDRTGLLYGIARVLARHHVNLQLAKISTLGERVEDTFLVDGGALQINREQLLLESELLDAITPPAAQTAPAAAAP